MQKSLPVENNSKRRQRIRKVIVLCTTKESKEWPTYAHETVDSGGIFLTATREAVLAAVEVRATQYCPPNLRVLWPSNSPRRYLHVRLVLDFTD